MREDVRRCIKAIKVFVKLTKWSSCERDQKLEGAARVGHISNRFNIKKKPRK